MKKGNYTLLKLLSCILGCIIIIAVALMFNTFSVDEGLKSLNNLYWSVFGIFFLFSLVIPLLIYIGYFKMKKLSPDTIQSRCEPLWEQYSFTFIENHVDTNLNGKTRANADLYFSSEKLMSFFFWGLPLLEYFRGISASFVGFGILGTFMGFSQFLGNIIDGGLNFESVEIFSGLNVAFNSSIIGLFSSIVYNLLISSPLNFLVTEANCDLCDSLDQNYYVSDEQCMRSLWDIISITEVSIDRNITNICEEIKDVIVTERNSFTEQVSKTVGLLEDINGSLNNIPDNIEAMSAELSESIELVKKKTAEITEHSLKIIDEKISNIFGQFADRFESVGSNIEQSMGAISAFPDNLTHMMEENIDLIKADFHDLLENIDTNLEFSFLKAKEEITVIFKELTQSSFENTKVLNEVTKDNLQEICENTEKRFTDLFNKVTATTGKMCSTLEKNVSENCSSFSSGVTECVNKIAAFTKETDGFTEEYRELHDVLCEISNEIIESGTNLIEEKKKIERLLDNLLTASISMRDTHTDFKDISECFKKFPEQMKEINRNYNNAANVMESSLNRMWDCVGFVRELSNKCNEIITGNDTL